MRRRIPWIVPAALLLFGGGVACSDDDGNGSNNNGPNTEIYECLYDETALSWDDATPERWDFDSYGAMVDHFAGTYAVEDNGNEGTLQIARGEGTPLERINTQGGCDDEIFAPISVTLTQGDMEWSHNFPYLVNRSTYHSESFSESQEYQALTAFGPLPDVDENQTITRASLRLELTASESIKLAFDVGVETRTGTGPDATVSHGGKPWLRFEAPLVEL